MSVNVNVKSVVVVDHAIAEVVASLNPLKPALNVTVPPTAI